VQESSATKLNRASLLPEPKSAGADYENYVLDQGEDQNVWVSQNSNPQKVSDLSPKNEPPRGSLT
jgi:hypothetical protein